MIKINRDEFDIFTLAARAFFRVYLNSALATKRQEDIDEFYKNIASMMPVCRVTETQETNAHIGIPAIHYEQCGINDDVLLKAGEPYVKQEYRIYFDGVKNPTFISYMLDCYGDDTDVMRVLKDATQFYNFAKDMGEAIVNRINKHYKESIT